MVFKKYRGTPFGVDFSPKEQKILDEEINRQILEKDTQYTNDIDASVLYVLHVHLGFGYKRLHRFWEAFQVEHKKLREHYEIPDSAYLAQDQLKRINVDVAAWNSEKGE